MAPVSGGGKPAADAEADVVTSGLQQLSSALQELAPKLSPSTLPIIPAEVALARLYPNDDCAKRLQSLKERAVADGLCASGKTSSDSLSWILTWEIDVVKRRKTPARLSLMGPHGATVSDLSRLIKLLTSQQVAARPDDSATSELVQHFLRANGHDVGEVHRLQDAVSVAHSMLVIHKELRLRELPGPPLRELLESATCWAEQPIREVPLRGLVPSADDSASGQTPKKKRRR
eukprot:gnl/TRDRNA2_/TRDRNA2_201994_c0_seq1.p1 gnl/TRDRNA2_/TRDRNA2_201994_c0~~gnl/TRDRNA2_/TRDRNA2_201994_c0_seq1.p1  ORF type:complete len:243 (+),score=54.58 gnl/TRDRNA2_/TRDRNA2_201994_c0_seq1:34-729(+)